MKNLHKKIGAMVLAGMVVFGGVAVSGVNSFAASSKANKVVASSKIGEEHQIKKVKFACKLLDGEVLEHSKVNNKNKVRVNRSIEKRSKVNKIYDQLELNLYNLRNRNKGKIVKVEYKGICYSIKF